MKIILFTFLLGLTQIAKSQSLIPLEVGNEWSYINTHYSNGIITKTDSTINSVLEKISIDGVNWYNLLEFETNFLVRNDATGQVEYDSITNKQVLIFKYPIDETLEYDFQELNHVQIDTNTNITTTTLDSYETIKYTITSKNDNHYYVENHISPGVGIIKSIWKEDSANYTISKLYNVTIK